MLEMSRIVAFELTKTVCMSFRSNTWRNHTGLSPAAKTEQTNRSQILTLDKKIQSKRYRASWRKGTLKFCAHWKSHKGL